MILTLNWRNGDHPLLSKVALSVKAYKPADPGKEAKEAKVQVEVKPGWAQIEISDAVESIHFELILGTMFRGSFVEVLRVDQTLQQEPKSTDLFPILSGTSYTVLTGKEKHRRQIPGLHPLIVFRGGSLLVVRAGLVDVTGLAPEFTERLEKLNPRASHKPFASTARILGRTDGTLPQFWYVATPHGCRGAPATDVLCDLPPAQNHQGIPSPVDIEITAAHLRDAVIDYGVLMLGTPTHDGGGRGIPEFTDHFTYPDGKLNVILARGLESALVASGKHALLAIPRPANLSHNLAATGALPGLLSDVHKVITALGDAHPPVVPSDPEQVQTSVASPRFALAAHSNGGLAIWGKPGGRPGALAAGKDAYTDLLLFEALDVQGNLHKLKASSARVVFVGFNRETVSGPFAALEKITVAGRVHRLPVTPAGAKAPEVASLDELATRSPSLALAKTGLVAGRALDEFQLKHQLCIWSGDMAGKTSGSEVHFMTQALLLSILR